MLARETFCSVYYSLLRNNRILKVFAQFFTYAMMCAENFSDALIRSHARIEKFLLPSEDDEFVLFVHAREKNLPTPPVLPLSMEGAMHTSMRVGGGISDMERWNPKERMGRKGAPRKDIGGVFELASAYEKRRVYVGICAEPCVRAHIHDRCVVGCGGAGLCE